MHLPANDDPNAPHNDSAKGEKKTMSRVEKPEINL